MKQTSCRIISLWRGCPNVREGTFDLCQHVIELVAGSRGVCRVVCVPRVQIQDRPCARPGDQYATWAVCIMEHTKLNEKTHNTRLVDPVRSK